MFSSEIARMRKLGVQGVSSHAQGSSVCYLADKFIPYTLSPRSRFVCLCVCGVLLPSLVIGLSLQWMNGGKK